MFTGIVAEKGTVQKARGNRGVLRLEIKSHLARDLARGDSIAVNGVCLTATRTGRRSFGADVVAETIERTTLGRIGSGDDVNLELPLRMSDRLGGHVVQGHVDGVATVVRIEAEGDSTRVWLRAGSDLLPYMVPKGSVALDGVSLTLAGVGETSFEIALIPHTLDVTTLGDWSVGTEVNVEVDLLAKYVERLLPGGNGRSAERT